MTYYSSWGVVVAVLSSFTFLNYTIRLVLIAIVALIFINAFDHRLTSLFRTHKERDERSKERTWEGSR